MRRRGDPMGRGASNEPAKSMDACITSEQQQQQQQQRCSRVREKTINKRQWAVRAAGAKQPRNRQTDLHLYIGYQRVWTSSVTLAVTRFLYVRRYRIRGRRTSLSSRWLRKKERREGERKRNRPVGMRKL